MPKSDVEKLAGRMYELLHTYSNIYQLEPEFNPKDSEYIQILDELTILQETERRLVDSGDIFFPVIHCR